MKRVVFRPEARCDVLDAQQWYEQQRAGLGQEFQDEVRRAIETIREGPLRWPVVRRQTRRYLLRRFP